MTYIVLEIRKLKDGSVKTVVSAYENKNQADNKFFNTMANAAISEFPMHSCIMVTESGSPMRYDSYTHEQPEPEPTEGETTDPTE